MKLWMVRLVMLAMVSSLAVGCGSSKSKRGCPSSSSSMGAERVLAGEKPDKKQKFKVKY